jgi:Na+(H+)/acetate symporter ActP
VIATVFFGGMRSMTFVQAFQFWFKVMALAVPAVVLLVIFMGDSRPFNQPAPPTFPKESTVDIHTDVQLSVLAPVDLRADGLVDGVERDGPVRWEPGLHTAARGATLTFPAGAAVPVVTDAPATDADWVASDTARQELFSVYSLLLALFLGTMGLPNVLARFYTNADGRAARRTAVVALAMVGGFFLLPVLFGALSRLYTPQLLVNDETDAAVLLLPAAVLGDGVWAEVLAGVVAAGAWAAFLSTATGLVVSAAGVLSTDVLPRRLRNIRFAGLVATVVPLALTLILSTRLDFADTVALAFAVAASTFCPLLLLGIWWRGLTAAGAVAGLLVGGIGSGCAVGWTLLTSATTGWAAVLLGQPAAWSVPAALATMVVVSRATRSRIPAHAGRFMVRLHTPEAVDLAR